MGAHCDAICIETKRKNEMDYKKFNGTSYRGCFKMPYAKLVEAIGEPNLMSDGYKTDVEWGFERDGVVATIYNWKNGPNYTGRGTVEDVDEWNVGGHGLDAMDVVSALLMQR
jgi:hypothetical protein